MATTRRQFLKRSAGAVTVSLVLPRLWLGSARAQTVQDVNRRIFVVIQLAGGNDGLNTVVPYSNATYQSLRPTLGFKDTELKDAGGASTIIDTSVGRRLAAKGDVRRQLRHPKHLQLCELPVSNRLAQHRRSNKSDKRVQRYK